MNKESLKRYLKNNINNLKPKEYLGACRNCALSKSNLIDNGFGDIYYNRCDMACAGKFKYIFELFNIDCEVLYKYDCSDYEEYFDVLKKYLSSACISFMEIE